MKKRFTAIVLSLCLILALLPATAFAQTAAPEEETSPPITVGGVDLESTAANPVAYAITDESGNVATEGANDTNYNVKWDGETLTLRTAPFTLKLEGRNTLTSLENTHAGKGISATIEDYGTVDPTVPYALTICGDGSLDVTGITEGIALAGNLIIKSGTVTATATTAQSTYPSFGIGTMEVGNIYIEGGKVTAIGGASSTFSAGFYIMVMSNENTGQVPGGTVRITGGEVTAVSGEITETDEEEPVPISPGSFGTSPTAPSLSPRWKVRPLKFRRVRTRTRQQPSRVLRLTTETMISRTLFPMRHTSTARHSLLPRKSRSRLFQLTRRRHPPRRTLRSLHRKLLCSLAVPMPQAATHTGQLPPTPSPYSLSPIRRL